MLPWTHHCDGCWNSLQLHRPPGILQDHLVQGAFPLPCGRPVLPSLVGQIPCPSLSKSVPKLPEGRDALQGIPVSCPPPSPPRSCVSGHGCHRPSMEPKVFLSKFGPWSLGCVQLKRKFRAEHPGGRGQQWPDSWGRFTEVGWDVWGRELGRCVSPPGSESPFSTEMTAGDCCCVQSPGHEKTTSQGASWLPRSPTGCG